MAILSLKKLKEFFNGEQEPTQPNIRILMFDLKSKKKMFDLKSRIRFQQHAFPYVNAGFHDTSSDSTDVY
jgi:hypothetical protein